ncbi:MAG: hypothetical protein NZ529_09385 [Cytophagaceae bacterium]|nr:hypothetical protein [Cytophagaceae bacterium]MDW8456997.1 hypothetical protein [Cytophagaceae bacterium]
MHQKKIIDQQRSINLCGYNGCSYISYAIIKTTPGDSNRNFPIA